MVIAASCCGMNWLARLVSCIVDVPISHESPILSAYHGHKMLPNRSWLGWIEARTSQLKGVSRILSRSASCSQPLFVLCEGTPRSSHAMAAMDHGSAIESDYSTPESLNPRGPK